jgi:hypothetical protein
MASIGTLRPSGLRRCLPLALDMNCALCQTESDLCDSHIIPEFMYEAMYDEKHRFHSISLHPDGRSKYRQKGAYEKLLCFECEQKLSVHETYAKKLFFSGLPLTERRNADSVEFQGVDCKQLKLFQLSVVWRASVSKLDFFENIQLGPHQERLRSILFAGKPPPSECYPCLVSAVLHDGSGLQDFMLQPFMSRVLGVRVAQFFFGGFRWIFFINSSAIPNQLHKLAIDESGVILIGMKQLKDIAFIKTIAKQVAQKIHV